MKGYKILDRDMVAVNGDCMMYELGEEYTTSKAEYSYEGFHFATKLAPALESYSNVADVRVFIVDSKDGDADWNYSEEYKYEEGDSYDTNNYKLCSNKIVLEKELTVEEAKEVLKKEIEEADKLYGYDSVPNIIIDSVFYANQIIDYDFIEKYKNQISDNVLIKVLETNIDTFSNKQIQDLVNYVIESDDFTRSYFFNLARVIAKQDLDFIKSVEPFICKHSYYLEAMSIDYMYEKYIDSIIKVCEETNTNNTEFLNKILSRKDKDRIVKYQKEIIENPHTNINNISTELLNKNMESFYKSITHMNYYMHSNVVFTRENFDRTKLWLYIKNKGLAIPACILSNACLYTFFSDYKSVKEFYGILKGRMTYQERCLIKSIMSSKIPRKEIMANLRILDLGTLANRLDLSKPMKKYIIKKYMSERERNHKKKMKCYPKKIPAFSLRALGERHKCNNRLNYSTDFGGLYPHQMVARLDIPVTLEPISDKQNTMGVLGKPILGATVADPNINISRGIINIENPILTLESDKSVLNGRKYLEFRHNTIHRPDKALLENGEPRGCNNTVLVQTKRPE